MPAVEQNPRLLPAGQYTLDPQHSTLLFRVSHLGLSDFIGRFNHLEASLDFDPQRIEAAKLNAMVEMDSIDVNNAALERALRGAFWLNSARFPKAYFSTDEVYWVDARSAEFLGQLSFLGVTRPLRLRVVFNGAADNLLTGKYTLGFSASSRFNRSEFGLDRDIPVVGDQITLEIQAEFQRL